MAGFANHCLISLVVGISSSQRQGKRRGDQRKRWQKKERLLEDILQSQEGVFGLSMLLRREGKLKI